MLSLTTANLTCAIDPSLGGCIRSLRVGTHDVLRPSPDTLATARQASSYPLVPCSNRIAGGVLHWKGRTWQLALNNAPEPHAIHGIGWQLPWDIVSSGADHAQLLLRHGGDERWPFAFESRQAFRLSPGALDLELSLHNTGTEVMPAGLGWHPFFVKRPGARIQVRTQARWEMGADKLPTTRAAHAGLDGPTDGLDVDHCFEGWDRIALLEDAVMRVRIVSALQRVVVFTTPARDVVAIEPVSHANNAYGAWPGGSSPSAGSLGAVGMAPGATFSATMRIEVAAK
jgi:aldose 1-epimerase